ncbi:hypothetical protein ACLKMH_16735 [Psychromonas sp. KJ10-10]
MQGVFEDGFSTSDLSKEGEANLVSTAEFGDLVCEKLAKMPV